jgi:periplasmic protein TonB
MNTDIIMKSDVLDILFENRNKLYGAYPLRKFYTERIKTSLAIMISGVFVFCLFALTTKEINEDLTFRVLDGPTMGSVPPPEKKTEPKPKASVPKKIINTQKFISNIKITKDSADKLTDHLDDIKIGSVNISNGVDGGPVEGPVVIAQPAAQVNALPEPDPAVPVENPEVEPSFPGGITALRTFLQRNLSNPRDLEEGEQASVQIKFIVGYDGHLQRFETVKDGGEEFNSEVIRVLKKMPQWIAGKSNGRNVSVYYTIPVKFVPND